MDKCSRIGKTVGNITDEEFKNLEIGKEFTFGNKKILVLKSAGGSCLDCIFRNLKINCTALETAGFIPECYNYKRKDNECVIFVEATNENLE